MRTRSGRFIRSATGPALQPVIKKDGVVKRGRDLLATRRVVVDRLRDERRVEQSARPRRTRAEALSEPAPKPFAHRSAKAHLPPRQHFLGQPWRECGLESLLRRVAVDEAFRGIRPASERRSR